MLGNLMPPFTPTIARSEGKSTSDIEVTNPPQDCRRDVISALPNAISQSTAPAIIRQCDIITTDQLPKKGYLEVHPRYRTWLRRCGIVRAEQIFELPAEVVSGHPDRHVTRVELSSGTGKRVVFVKREHRIHWRVRWKNSRAGFGWVSRSKREAHTLQNLEDAQLPGPQWIAHGEDHLGRAFLIVDSLAGSRELREHLEDPQLTQLDRCRLFQEIGATIASFHGAGFSTPDLSAKHVFVRIGTQSINLLDWPSSEFRVPVSLASRVRSLARLSASLSSQLVSTRERLRMLFAYRKALQKDTDTPTSPSFRDWIALIQHDEAKLTDRPSLREQRQPFVTPHRQRLVWLSGEAVVVSPELAADWPTPAIAPPFYVPFQDVVSNGKPIGLTLPDGRESTLIRFRTGNLATQFWSWIRGAEVRSPATRLARTLFQLERYLIPVPTLLAFGQRHVGSGKTDSFFLYQQAENSQPLPQWLESSGSNLKERWCILRQLGSVLHRCHAAGFAPNSADPFRINSTATAELKVDPVAALTRARRLRDSRKKESMLAVLQSMKHVLSRTDILRVLNGYHETALNPRADAHTYSRLILSKVLD